MGRAKDRHLGRSESEVKMEQTTNYNLKKPADNENADIADVNDNMDIIDTALKNLADDVEEAAAAAGNTDIITASNLSVPTSAWTSNTTYEEFPYRAAITIAGCTAAYKPDVTLSLTDAMSGNFAPIAESYAGGIYIYAAAVPDATTAIPNITLLKEVE